MAMTTGTARSNFIVIHDGHGSDTITDFCPARHVITFNMSEITSYPDVQARISQTDNDTRITFDNADTLRLRSVRPSLLDASNFEFTAEPTCVLEGTVIFTQRGDIAIECLRPDDIVWTKDHGWQTIRLVVREDFNFQDRDDPAKPILIPAGALGPNQPRQALVTSPQHRLLRTLRGLGKEVLVPAVDLIGTKGIRQMRGRSSARYFNVVMQRHSIIQAAGCWVESLLVTSPSLSRQAPSVRRLLDRTAGMEPARRIERLGVRPRNLRSA